jgi:hypothetical protein
MANKQNTTEKILRNGFEPVTRTNIECNAHITYEQASAMGAIFQAIERLTSDGTIKQLCKHGALQADLQANDIDAMLERAMKAGVIGELVDEVAGDH